MIRQKTEAIARIAELPKGYPNLVLVRCPFCGELHQHSVSKAERLLGVPIHRGAHCCTLDDADFYRGRRRRQLEEGKALSAAAGNAYHVPLLISLYARYRGGKLVGEERK